MNRAYVAATCRAKGVPDFWLDDAIQDVLINCWRTGDDRINRAVIDAARKYGPRTRRGILRAVPMSRSVRVVRSGGRRVDTWHDPYASIAAAIDATRAILKLSPQQRRNLFAPFDGVNATQVKRARARRHLRSLVA